MWISIITATPQSSPKTVYVYEHERVNVDEFQIRIAPGLLTFA
jgi:hypothetical protein